MLPYLPLHLRAAFQKAGFDSSRRGLNLETRFKRDCPKQQKDAEKKGLSSPEETREIYDKLGQVQGYWDNRGNTLKQLEAIPEKEDDEDDKPQGRMSKKERVEQLTQRVADLPLGQETKDKINTLTQGLDDLGQKPAQPAGAVHEGDDQRLFEEALPHPAGRIGKKAGG